MVNQILPFKTIHVQPWICSIFDGSIDILKSEKEKFTLDKCSFVSLFNSPYQVKLSSKIHAIHIRFKPAGVYPLADLPLNKILNRQVSLEDLMAKDTSEIYNRMGELDNPKKQIALFEQWILKTYQESNQHYRFNYGLHLIEEQKGKLSVKDLSLILNSNYKSLDRWFNKMLGMNPKEYLQISKFKSILDEIENQKNTSWMTLVADFDYHDQAHFSKSFKKYAGVSPNQYLTSLTESGVQFLQE